MSDDKDKKTKDETTKPAEAAPYLKKDKEADASSKNSVVMPVVLLLVSAIVIGATIYKYQYEKNQQLQAEETQAVTLESASDNVTPASEDTAVTEQAPAETAAQAMPLNNQPPDITAQETEQSVESTQTAEEIPAASDSAPSDSAEKAGSQATEENKTATASSAPLAETDAEPKSEPGDWDLRRQQFEDRIAEMKARSDRNRTAFADDKAFEEARKSAIAEARERAETRYEMMKQRRLEYEKEMEAKRQEYEKEMAEKRMQYEAMRKAQRDKQPDRYDAREAAREAELQHLDKIREQTRKKVDERLKRIADLQDEIRQIIYESRMQYRESAEKLAPAPLPAGPAR